ncbi:MAG: YbaN family protein [Colwellia sp.]
MKRTISKDTSPNHIGSVPNLDVIHSNADPLGVLSKEDIVQCPLTKPEQHKVKTLCLKVAGVFFVGLAILGAILPILPTTVFLILATACFAKSSPRMEKKLLANKTFGPLINDWQTYRSIPLKAKRMALICICLSVAWSSYLLNNIMLTGLVVLLVAWPVIFIWQLPLTEDRNRERG